MSKVSDEVQNRVKELYAVMATAAAKKAISKIHYEDAAAADAWAAKAELWLIRAGANAARWTFEKPKSL